MSDLSYPAHVADVEEAVDPILDLDERAVIGEISDDARDDGPGGIFLRQLVPWVRLNLLHPQGDLLLLLVDVENLNLDLIADGHQFARMVDSLRPAHFADVDEPLDARFELDKGAVAHHVDDFAGMPATDGTFD